MLSTLLRHYIGILSLFVWYLGVGLFRALSRIISFFSQFTLQLALAGFAEFVLHLTRMNPDMMYLHQDSGFLNIAYFKFDIDDQTGRWLIS